MNGFSDSAPLKGFAQIVGERDTKPHHSQQVQEVQGGRLFIVEKYEVAPQKEIVANAVLEEGIHTIGGDPGGQRPEDRSAEGRRPPASGRPPCRAQYGPPVEAQVGRQ